ncbi:HepT-like ribonuclease domain-containing protein [Methanoculleus caldifontis]|uniref:HepT-like ribonuclease domain-containing protein n=1 Tax=Methanoculleus caldifontis TaxID=2651577 RepID=UPI00374211C5
MLRLITIGEATNRISLSVTARSPEVEWRKIAGLREISVHSYYAAKPTLLRDIRRVPISPAWRVRYLWLPDLKPPPHRRLRTLSG